MCDVANFVNLTQLKRYLKEHPDTFYYVTRLDGSRSLRRCFKAQGNAICGVDAHNHKIWFWYPPAADLIFDAGEFKTKDGIQFEFNHINKEEKEKFVSDLAVAIEAEEAKIQEFADRVVAEEAKEEAERQEKLDKVQNQFINHERISNEDFLALCKRHNVEIHLRTHGFFKKAVVEVYLYGDDEPGYSFYKGHQSSYAFTIIKNLRDKIKHGEIKEEIDDYEDIFEFDGLRRDLADEF